MNKVTKLFLCLLSLFYISCSSSTQSNGISNPDRIPSTEAQKFPANFLQNQNKELDIYDTIFIDVYQSDDYEKKTDFLAKYPYKDVKYFAISEQVKKIIKEGISSKTDELTAIENIGEATEDTNIDEGIENSSIEANVLPPPTVTEEVVFNLARPETIPDAQKQDHEKVQGQWCIIQSGYDKNFGSFKPQIKSDDISIVIYILQAGSSSTQIGIQVTNNGDLTKEVTLSNIRITNRHNYEIPPAEIYQKQWKLDRKNKTISTKIQSGRSLQANLCFNTNNLFKDKTYKFFFTHNNQNYFFKI